MGTRHSISLASLAMDPEEESSSTGDPSGSGLTKTKKGGSNTASKVVDSANYAFGTPPSAASGDSAPNIGLVWKNARLAHAVSAAARDELGESVRESTLLCSAPQGEKELDTILKGYGKDRTWELPFSPNWRFRFPLQVWTVVESAIVEDIAKRDNTDVQNARSDWEAKEGNHDGFCVRVSDGVVVVETDGYAAQKRWDRGIAKRSKKRKKGAEPGEKSEQEVKGKEDATSSGEDSGNPAKKQKGLQSCQRGSHSSSNLHLESHASSSSSSSSVRDLSQVHEIILQSIRAGQDHGQDLNFHVNFLLRLTLKNVERSVASKPSAEVLRHLQATISQEIEEYCSEMDKVFTDIRQACVRHLL